jgi:hypothetical protein
MPPVAGGDALVVRWIEVLEIVDSSPPKPHKLTPFARVDGKRVTYLPKVTSVNSDSSFAPGGMVK